MRLQLFCRSAEPVEAEDVTTLALMGEFFADWPDVRIEGESEGIGWSAIHFTYDTERAPVTVRRVELESASRTAWRLRERGVSERTAARVAEARTVLELETGRDLTAEAEELVEALSAGLATHFDGLIHRADGVGRSDAEPELLNGCLLPV